MRDEVIYCKSPNYPRPSRPGAKDNSNLDKIFGGSKMVLDNRVYVEDNKCEKCENNSICKWCEEMKSAREYVDSMPKIKDLTPIKIRIVCNSFKKKKERQDGWRPTNRDLY